MRKNGRNREYQQKGSLEERVRQLERDNAALTQAIGELTAAVSRADMNFHQVIKDILDLRESFTMLAPIVQMSKDRLMGQSKDAVEAAATPAPEVTD